MVEILFGVMTIVVLLAAVLVIMRLSALASAQHEVLNTITQGMEERHRSMLADLHEGFLKQGDRLNQNLHELSDRLSASVQENGERLRASLLENGDRLRTSAQESADRLRTAVSESTDRLQAAVSQELNQTRDSMSALQQKQADALQNMQFALTESLRALEMSQMGALNEARSDIDHQLTDVSTQLKARQEALREELLSRLMTILADQGRGQQELIQLTMKNTAQQLTSTIETLTMTVDVRLEQINEKVAERLDEGFRKTNDSFAHVLNRLATVDAAREKIDALTMHVTSLEDLLDTRRARGAFGEMQLETLIKNMLPAQTYGFRAQLANGAVADCVLSLPEPTGQIVINASLPLDNYHRMVEEKQTDARRAEARLEFGHDVRAHIDLIATSQIIPGQTLDGVLLFIPAEAVFAELHAHHPELVTYAMQKRVWLTSPTTMMAVLNTARSVIKEVETRAQVHVMKTALVDLGLEFKRFDIRMKKLGENIQSVHQDVQAIQESSASLTAQFETLEHVDLGELAPPPLPPIVLAAPEVPQEQEVLPSPEESLEEGEAEVSVATTEEAHAIEEQENSLSALFEAVEEAESVVVSPVLAAEEEETAMTTEDAVQETALPDSVERALEDDNAALGLELAALDIPDNMPDAVDNLEELLMKEDDK